jgi:hypothetical protein
MLAALPLTPSKETLLPAHDETSGPEPIVVQVRSTTPITAHLDEHREWVCVDLPAQPRPILLAATEASAEELIAVMTLRLRELRGHGGQRPDRPRRALGTALTGEIAPALAHDDRTEEPR